jgi:hypothetical protein
MVGPDAQPAHQNSLCHKQIGERLEATAMIILNDIVIEQFPLVGVDHFTVAHASVRVRRGLDANFGHKCKEGTKAYEASMVI